VIHEKIMVIMVSFVERMYVDGKPPDEGIP
jgi:hypothetical protein